MQKGLLLFYSAAVLALAGFAVFFAFLRMELDCGDSGDSCHPVLVTAQFVVALAGLVPAAGMVHAINADRRGRARKL